MNNTSNIVETNNIAFDEEAIDLKGWLMKFVRKWYYFAISLPFFMALAFVYIRFAPPKYLVKTTLFISEKGKANQIDSKDYINKATFYSSGDNIDNEVGILTSHYLISRTLKQLDFGVSYFEKQMIGQRELYNNSPFFVTVDSFSNQIAETPFEIKYLGKNEVSVSVLAKKVRLYNPIENRLSHRLIELFEHSDTVAFGEVSSHPFLNFKIERNPSYDPSYGAFTEEKTYAFVIKNLDLFAQEYIERLNIDRINQGATILEISLNGAVPEKESKFLSTLTDQYILNQLEQKNIAAQKAIDFIDSYLATVSASLQVAEDQREEVKVKGNFLNAQVAAQQAISQLNDLKYKESNQKVKIRYYRYLERYLQNNSDAADVVIPTSMDVNNSVLNEQVLKIQALSTQYRSLLGVSGEENFDVRQVKSELDQVKKSLLQNINTSLNTSENLLTEIRSQIASKQAKIKELPSAERQLGQIQREFDLNDDLYKYLMEKRAEAGIARASNSLENKVLDNARQIGEKPTSPKKPIILGAAFVLSLLIPIGLILTQDFLHSNVSSQEEIERLTSVPMVGVIGKKSSKDGQLKDDRTSNIAEAFRSMRVNLQFIAPDKEKKVMAFTSTVSAEGKTFCSANLATMLALSDKKVILLGADLRKPRLFEHFKIGDKRGITELLIGDAKLDEVIRQQHQISENLYIINSGVEPPMNPVELLSSNNFKQLVEQLKHAFDYVIIDTPPVGLVSDYFVLKDLVDVTLYVVRYGYSKIKYLQDLEKAFKANKFNDISLVFNGVSNNSPSGYYGYGYGYNYNNYYKKGAKKRRRKSGSSKKGGLFGGSKKNKKKRSSRTV